MLRPKSGDPVVTKTKGGDKITTSKTTTIPSTSVSDPGSSTYTPTVKKGNPANYPGYNGDKAPTSKVGKELQQRIQEGQEKGEETIEYSGIDGKPRKYLTGKKAQTPPTPPQSEEQTESIQADSFEKKSYKKQSASEYARAQVAAQKAGQPKPASNFYAKPIKTGKMVATTQEAGEGFVPVQKEEAKRRKPSRITSIKSN